jgi:hypothetical protein
LKIWEFENLKMQENPVNFQISTFSNFQIEPIFSIYVNEPRINELFWEWINQNNKHVFY